MKFLSRIVPFLPVIFILSSLSSSHAWAYMVSPLRADLAMGSATTISVSNARSDKPLTYETSIVKRIIKPDGSVESKPAPDDFVVIPPSGIVEAGSSQALRVQYVGEEAEQHSVHYYLNVSEIPIKLDTPKVIDPNSKIQATINMAFAYNVALNVAPPEGKADLKLISIEGGKIMEIKEKKENAIAFTIENIGNKYAYLQDYHLEITKPDGKKIVLQDKDLKRSDKTPLIPAQMKREFLLPVEEKFPAGALNARLF
jgi:fimbrial chaperone protein